MKAYFEGDKNILVFKPIQGSKKGRKKKKTNEERLKECGTKELAHELALIAEWDRGEVRKAKWTIVNKKDTIFKYIFWERLDSLPIPECCFHFVWCQIA